MATKKRLIDQLREMADQTPPICQYDKPEKTMIFGKEITVYCKPFEQFQELLRRAADALDVDAVEVAHGEWSTIEDDYTGMTALQCSECKEEWWFEDDPPIKHYHYCPNCGARMEENHGRNEADN